MNPNAVAMIFGGVIALGTALYYLFVDKEKPQSYERQRSRHSKPPSPPPSPPHWRRKTINNNTETDSPTYLNTVNRRKSSPQRNEIDNKSSTTESMNIPEDSISLQCETIKSKCSTTEAVNTTLPEATHPATQSNSISGTPTNSSSCETLGSNSHLENITLLETTHVATQSISGTPTNSSSIETPGSNSDFENGLEMPSNPEAVLTEQACNVCGESPCVKFLPCEHSYFCSEHANIYIEKAKKVQRYTMCPICQGSIDKFI